MNKKILYRIFLVLFIVIFSYFYGNNITCNKENNSCVVKSLFTNKVINEFAYSNIDNFYCRRDGRALSLMFREKTELAANNYQFGKEYSTLRYMGMYPTIACNNAIKSFSKFQKSSQNELKMRGNVTLLIEIVLLAFLIFVIFYIKDTFTFNKYKKNKNRDSIQ